MTETAGAEPKCSRCGTPLPPNAPEGLCPRCVLALNFSTETEIQGGTAVNKPLPPPPLPAADLAKLFPQLEILEYLGRGGMGAVYKARQPRLDRFVALKILSPEKQDDAQFGERFEREARTLARLNHPNIVTVYDFGKVNGCFFLLMEFVDGLSLRQLLQARKTSPEEALAIVPKICDALQYAHQRGIVHRDIKPENILMDKEGQVKIADFGIARILGQGPAARLTAEQQIIGTPHYMAPEQVERPQSVDHRADIFSLGVVFYEMLTGELPLGRFAAPSSRMTGVRVDVRLDEIVLRTLEKQPELRYQQASQVKQEVETIATSKPPPGAAASPQPSRRRFAWKAAVAGVSLLMLMAVAFLLVSNLWPRPGDLRTSPATNAEIADRLRPASRRQPSPPITVYSAPEVAAPLIDIETFLAEVPSDFRPPRSILDHNTLRRQPGVRVLNAPRLSAPSGASAQLTVTDIQVADPAPGFTFRVEPTLDRGNIAYTLNITDHLKRLAAKAGPDDSAMHLSISKFSGIAPQGVPQPFDLGALENGRRLMGIMVFWPGDRDSSDKPPSSAVVSNPEFQQVINLESTDRNGIVFFDFETGRLLKPPMNVSFDPATSRKLTLDAGLREWIAKEDVDIMFALDGFHWHQLLLDMNESGVPSSTKADTLSPEALQTFISPLTQLPPATNTAGQTIAVTCYLRFSDQARTPLEAFRTRKGTYGAFQCVPVADPPPGVKIRYRVCKPFPQ